MKKLLLLLSLFTFVLSINISAQTKLPTTTSKTFKWEEKEQEKTYDVKFNYMLTDVEMPQERLNSIIMNSIIQSKYKLKNKLTFKPVEIMIYAVEEEFKIFVKYNGKNSYGVESSLQSYFSFKNEGDGSVEHLFTK